MWNREEMRTAAVAAVASLLAGCASTVETVDHQLLLQPGTAQYQMAPLDLFVMPMELEAPLPAFPEGAPSGELAAVTACAELWLSIDGDITHVAAVRDAPGCAGPADPGAAPFERAVLASLGQWEFSPAMVCRFREDQRDKRARGDCRGDVEVVRVPVRLAYAFRFERHDGRVAVGRRRLSD